MNNEPLSNSPVVKPLPNFPPKQEETKKPEPTASSGASSLERSPNKDGFFSTQIKTEDVPKLLALAGLLVAAGAGIGSYLKGKNNDGALTSLRQQVQRNEGTISDQAERLRNFAQQVADQTSTIQKQEGKITEQAGTITRQAGELANRNNQIKTLQDMLDGLVASNPDNKNAVLTTFVEQYQKALDSFVLPYDAKVPPIQIDAFQIPANASKYKLSTLTSFAPKPPSAFGTVEPEQLKSRFRYAGSLDFSLPKTSLVKPVIAQDAFIGSKPIAHLGETMDTDLTLAYGRRVGWSDEKIARDIMQNFYDGHGNILDGVSLSLKKMPDGSTTVKISGEGLYSYENLQYLGSGTKEENPFNAGGFGEGTKVLVANLLGSGDASKVTFRCADWKLDFTPGEKTVQRTLNRTNANFQGNSIEFQTNNQHLVDAVIDSINYFNHGLNPDFQKLSFETEGFAFGFVPKGNIYLTQRFEFGQKGVWEGGLDDIQLAFKRKPDAATYKRITGCDLPKDRDRTQLTFKDIENLTKYFATTEMSEEQLMRTIVSTKDLWGKLPFDGRKDTALYSFLKGIIGAARDKNLALDVGDQRFAAYNYRCNKVVLDTLRSYGYTMLPPEFEGIHIPGGDKIFKSLSAHVALEPTNVEVKKLKLLQDAVEVIADNIENGLREYLLKSEIQLKPNGRLDDNTLFSLVKKYRDLVPSVEEFAQKHGSGDYFGFGSIDKLTDDEVREVSSMIFAKIGEELKAAAQNPHSPQSLEVINEAVSLATCPDLDAKSVEYLRTIKDFTLVTKADAVKPRFIFDRKAEIASNTLGESIVQGEEYLGHWVDREYLEGATFNEILATWLHEICHKSGGDGSSEFTYALTDLIRSLLQESSASAQNRMKLSAIEQLYEKLR